MQFTLRDSVDRNNTEIHADIHPLRNSYVTKLSVNPGTNTKFVHFDVIGGWQFTLEQSTKTEGGEEVKL
jgi:hypothetical protein